LVFLNEFSTEEGDLVNVFFHRVIPMSVIDRLFCLYLWRFDRPDIACMFSSTGHFELLNGINMLRVRKNISWSE